MGMGPVNVISRFMPDASMMEVVDDQTITFNLGKPQPLFLSAMASAYGPFIINTKYVEENKTDDDPWAHEFYLNGAPGSGTGPYMLTENQVTQQVTIEKFEASTAAGMARTSIRLSCGWSERSPRAAARRERTRRRA